MDKDIEEFVLNKLNQMPPHVKVKDLYKQIDNSVKSACKKWALRQTRGVSSMAAKAVGVNRNTFSRWPNE